MHVMLMPLGIYDELKRAITINYTAGWNREQDFHASTVTGHKVASELCDSLNFQPARANYNSEERLDRKEKQSV